MNHTANTTIYLALGTNLGQREANLRAAVGMLAPEVVVEQVSSLYETEPAYITNQPLFLNAVLRATTGLRPQELLVKLKQIEHDLGRAETVRNGPRLIDLDILAYGDLMLHEDDLVVPHPRLVERPFVLVPLAEIAPDVQLPGTTTTIGDLAKRVRGNGNILARIGSLDTTQA